MLPSAFLGSNCALYTETSGNQVIRTRPHLIIICEIFRRIGRVANYVDGIAH
jgi:hypothetical protein